MPSDPHPFTMGRAEFVALLAMMMASVAFSIDAMLPALPMIGQELTPDRPQNAPLILSMFLFGMGVGTFFTGPLSDSFGRKRVILVGSVLYILGAAIAWASGAFEMVLLGRVLQGLGAAGPRIVTSAIIRDRFSGRQMAQISSVIMMIFVMVPAVAPLLGSFIIAFSSWRGIFIAFMVFALTYSLWMGLRLPETLPAEKRRPLRLRLMFAALSEMARHPVVRLAIVVQLLVSSMMFLTLMLVHPVYDIVYGRGAEFPYWFFCVAVVSGGASLLNALWVVRLGMHRLVSLALGAQMVLSGAFTLFDLGGGALGFYFFLVWQAFIFLQAGLTFGNLTALAMEPMGHIAGMAASVVGAIATVGAVLVSAPIGTMFAGDERLLTFSVFVLAVMASGVMVLMGRASRRTGPV